MYGYLRRIKKKKIGAVPQHQATGDLFLKVMRHSTSCGDCMSQQVQYLDLFYT